MPIVISRQSNAADRARDVIAHHPHFVGRADSFQFECDGNLLIIRGRVPTFYLKQLVQDALKRLDGIRRIDNRVDVVASDGVSSTFD